MENDDDEQKPKLTKKQQQTLDYVKNNTKVSAPCSSAREAREYRDQVMSQFDEFAKTQAGLDLLTDLQTAIGSRPGGKLKIKVGENFDPAFGPSGSTSPLMNPNIIDPTIFLSTKLFEGGTYPLISGTAPTGRSQEPLQRPVWGVNAGLDEALFHESVHFSDFHNSPTMTKNMSNRERANTWNDFIQDDGTAGFSSAERSAVNRTNQYRKELGRPQRAMYRFPATLPSGQKGFISNPNQWQQFVVPRL